jgi:phosphoglycolate phosphatase
MEGPFVTRTILTDATIVFDLDGTLVNTAPDLTNALNDVLTRRGHVPVSANDVRATVGLGARAMIEAALARTGAEEDIDAMLAEFLVHYDSNIADESRPYPGAIEALARLEAAGARLAICTNKREYLTHKLLRALDLDGRFQAVAGRDTFAAGKPNPLPLTGVIAAAAGDTARALMVGDSDVDIRTARAAAVPVVYVSFGYGAPKDGEPPDATIDHFDALEEALEDCARHWR